MPRASGDLTWRAEITIPREGGSGLLGKRGTTQVRGPSRVNKDVVQEDIDQLVDGYKKGGNNEMRKVQRELIARKTTASNYV